MFYFTLMKKERNWKKWQCWNNLWEVFCQKGFLWSLGVGDMRNSALQMTALVGTSRKLMGWIHKFLPAGGQAASPYPRSQTLVLLSLEAASKPRVCDRGRLGPVEQRKFFSETGKAALGPDLVSMMVTPHPSPSFICPNKSWVHCNSINFLRIPFWPILWGRFT